MPTRSSLAIGTNVGQRSHPWQHGPRRAICSRTLPPELSDHLPGGRPAVGQAVVNRSLIDTPRAAAIWYARSTAML